MSPSGEPKLELAINTRGVVVRFKYADRFARLNKQRFVRLQRQ